ncbi:OmpW/AlkL family protein [Chitinophaga ginsengisoli]|uniref:Outer membrane protein n=1 Tax=Chitinophaga ginsengisoli TaxID=363837 RepID=A0A2P8FNT7_9BACT|nr:OmpW family outer membrane protein [Chitinophaga ginsengisoli]PSL23369.1 outer membrane protein [Chitinophaga ginsengisoli]
MKKLLLFNVLCCLSLLGFAQQKGEWRARLRATAVVPDASATISTIGGSADISNTVIPELDFTYFLFNRVSANLILGTTRHKVTATGTALGDVDLGKVWLLPPTLTFLYHQPVSKGILPYVGAGINYTIFYGIKEGPAIADISYKNKFGFATQLGLDIDISKKWFINIDAKKIWLKTENTVTTVPEVAGGATVHADTKINPWLLSVGAGFKF